MGKRGPAPKGEYSGQTAVLSTRITPDLRAQLEAEVKKSGKTLSREIEHRLRRTFVEDDKISEAFGSRQNYALMKMVSMVIETWHNPSNLSLDWRFDPLGYDQVCRKINCVLEAMRPEGTVQRLNDLEQAVVDLEATQKPLALIYAVQNADNAIPLEGSRKKRSISLIKSDLGPMIDRPEIIFGTTDKITNSISEKKDANSSAPKADSSKRSEK